MRDDSAFNIRELELGQKISEPGFYRIPIEVHHSQCCEGVSVTSSVLRGMELKTPGDVWAYHDLNRNRWQRKETAALRLGRAMAAYVEGGPEELEQHFYVPDEKPSRPTQAQLIAIREGRGTSAGLKSYSFWKKADADPRTMLTESEWDLICTMGRVLAEDPIASVAFDGEPEITMAWFDEINQLWCLARPDLLSFSGLLSDYKKVNSNGRTFSAALCDDRITGHGYDMQMAFAREGFIELTGQQPDQVGLVFQWDEPPYWPLLRGVQQEDLEIGEFRNRRARHRFRECLDLGHWPGPNEHVGDYHRPDHHRERLLEEMNTAAYP